METKKSRALVAICIIFVLLSGSAIIHTFNQSPVVDIFSQVLANKTGRTLTKTIKKNYAPGQLEKEFYYEEYIDDFWWRGTLTAEERRPISDKLIEVTFSGELYKCKE